MSGFAIKTPYLIVVVSVIVAVLGIVSIGKMPVDMFPAMDIPVVAVATFYSGMPPEQVESDITYHLERMFTLAGGIDHMDSRSLPGVSLIKIYFHPGTDPGDAAATISTLAMADMKDMPPGTYPPIVLQSDASGLPVCLVTLAGQGLSESVLKDIGQNVVRNELASVPGASVPQPFGGRWRQIMLYTDPYKLEANQLSLMDVVRSLNNANVILPAGDVRIGRYDYNIYTNALLTGPDEIDQVPLKMVGQSPVRAMDVGVAQDSFALQYNIVRVNGQRAVYLPVLKQGGGSNTIAISNGIRATISHLYDTPKQMRSAVVFDQSKFVKTAIDTLLHEGAIGLFLTCVMILVFLGSMRATVAVCFSIPLSILATAIVLQLGGQSINSMVLGGLALALSRLIDNSVVVLENIFRHLQEGEILEIAATEGAREVALPVLAGTLTTIVVFFPVTMLYGVSKFLFTALALAVAISLFASYIVAMTVVPLFCSRFLKGAHHVPYQEDLQEELPEAASKSPGMGERFNRWFSAQFDTFLERYNKFLAWILKFPATVLYVTLGGCLITLILTPWLQLAFFPQTDAGQFMINIKAPSGTRLSVTEQMVAGVERLIRRTVAPGDLDMILSNIGVNPGFSALFSPNSAMHTAVVQVGLKSGHRESSFAYIRSIKQSMAKQMPELSAFFSSGSLVDAVLNEGAPAPIDIQVAGNNLKADYAVAQQLAAGVRRIPNVADVYIPQDLDYPSIRLDIDRVHASELGLSEKEVVSNVITALTSNLMIAPSIWIDPKNGNNYFLTVQYKDHQIRDLNDLKAIPLHGLGLKEPTRLDMLSKITRFEAPTEVDHSEIRRRIDIYVRPATEDLGRITSGVQRVIDQTPRSGDIGVSLHGSVESMYASFRSFAVGLVLSVILLYLILVAQFKSLVDPVIVLLALPPGIAGVILALILTGTSLNIMSLMGVVMLAGIAMSNSILIVEFAQHLRSQGSSVQHAISFACRARLRPILMTSLATVIGLLPMALKMGEGSEAYAPLARALIGGLSLSVIVTIFLVPAGYYCIYGKTEATE